jgi:hypothetical protein
MGAFAISAFAFSLLIKQRKRRQDHALLFEYRDGRMDGRKISGVLRQQIILLSEI